MSTRTSRCALEKWPFSTLLPGVMEVGAEAKEAKSRDFVVQKCNLQRFVLRYSLV